MCLSFSLIIFSFASPVSSVCDYVQLCSPDGGGRWWIWTVFSSARLCCKCAVFSLVFYRFNWSSVWDCVCTNLERDRTVLYISLTGFSVSECHYCTIYHRLSTWLDLFSFKGKGSNVHIGCQDRNCSSNLRQRWMRSNLPGFSAKQLKQEIKKLGDKIGGKDWGVCLCA